MDFVGRVWRCTFRWWEQTAAFLFCHLTFWWGDVSPAAGSEQRVGGWWGTVAAGACVFWGFTPLLQEETGHGRLQSVLARSLSSLTLFTQSSLQLSQAPSVVSQDTLLWHTPPCMVQFWTLLFVFCFIVAFFVHCCSLNVSYLQSFACSSKGNLSKYISPFILKFYSFQSSSCNLTLHIHATESAICFIFSRKAYSIFCQKKSRFVLSSKKKKKIQCSFYFVRLIIWMTGVERWCQLPAGTVCRKQDHTLKAT